MRLHRKSAGLFVASMATLITGVAPAGAGVATPPSPTAQAAARYALSENHAPFVYGGASAATGFDNSGLIVWAFGKAGRGGLPHASPLLIEHGTRVAPTHLERGDVVLFYGASHAGIYLGHGEFIHASNPARGVRIDSLAGYYRNHLTGAVRIS
jgi:cell wall-associated NlpC family hydrolase